MNGIIEWALFGAFSLIAVVTAAGMLITMSMYRAGLALMASFVALAGLFILLDADLLAAIQVMMNVGGMLVMVLFMVMIMMDPGGEMMWGMKRDMHIPGIGAFSMHMPRGKPPAEVAPATENSDEETTTWTCPMHADVRLDHPGTCPKCGMTLIPSSDTTNEAGHVQHRMAHDMSGMAMAHDDEGHGMNTDHGDHAMAMSHHDMDMSSMNMSPRQNYQMMVDMAMSTAQLPWAIVLGVTSALLLILLFVKTPWPLAHVGPTQDATTMVGELLLSRYMIGFEGAAFLILAGIAGAVILARRERQESSMQSPAPAQIQGASKKEEEQTYTCPMHPEIRQNQPGNCPKCGMALVPVQEGAGQGSMQAEGMPEHKHQHGGHT